MGGCGNLSSLPYPFGACKRCTQIALWAMLGDNKTRMMGPHLYATFGCAF